MPCGSIQTEYRDACPGATSVNAVGVQGSNATQQLRQLGDVGGDGPGRVARKKRLDQHRFCVFDHPAGGRFEVVGDESALYRPPPQKELRHKMMPREFFDKGAPSSQSQEWMRGRLTPI